MPTYQIAAGRTINTAAGVLRHPSPCDGLIPADIALYLADGTIEAVPSPAPSAAALSPEPIASSTPDLPPVVEDAVPAPALPDKFPRSSAMAAHLKGKPEAYILAMQANDTRSGLNIKSAYKAALRALRS